MEKITERKLACDVELLSNNLHATSYSQLRLASRAIFLFSRNLKDIIKSQCWNRVIPGLFSGNVEIHGTENVCCSTIFQRKIVFALSLTTTLGSNKRLDRVFRKKIVNKIPSIFGVIN